MRWRFYPTTGGGYKIVPQTGMNNNLVMAVESSIGFPNGWKIKQMTYSNNSDYKDEWNVMPLFFATVNCYYDYGYPVYYSETPPTAESRITSYLSNIAERYGTLLGLIIEMNTPSYYSSPIDVCKGTVTPSNIDLLCSHSGTTHTDRSNVLNSFSESFSGSNTITNVLWSCHRIKSIASSGATNYNRSCSRGTSILMIERSTSANRDRDSKSVLMHELNHQYGAPDHYHELGADGICKNKAICSECGDYRRSEACIMNNSRTDINRDDIICDDCLEDIVSHLGDHHLSD